MIYGSVKSIGIDPKGMEDIPSKYLTSEGMAIILHCCASRWKYSDLSLNNSAQISRFWPKHCWFSILAHNFNQNYSQNAKFGSVRPIELVFYSTSPAVNLLLKVLIKLQDCSFKNTKFSSFWGGHIPLQTPPCAQHKITPHPHVKRLIYTPG